MSATVHYGLRVEVIDFEVQRCTRKCAKTDRELQPGETFYSALLPVGAEVVRQDFAQEAWQGPPEGALGWWKSQMPDVQAKRLHWAPNDVMLDYFEQLTDRPDKEDVRYVLALLMIRRRVVRLEETQTDSQGQPTLLLYCPRNENQYQVSVVTPGPERTEEIQNELAQLLFAKGV